MLYYIIQRQVDNRLVHPLPFPWSHGRGFQAINQKGHWQRVFLETGEMYGNLKHFKIEYRYLFHILLLHLILLLNTFSESSGKLFKDFEIQDS